MSECIDHGKVGTGKGYAQRSVGNRMRYMHRLAYADAHGLDEGTMGGVVRHTCDNPRCVNPAHLLIGTLKDNTQDMLQRGRNMPPKGARNGNARLTEGDVVAIREATGRQWEIALRFNVTQGHVSRIKGGKLWRNS